MTLFLGSSLEQMGQQQGTVIIQVFWDVTPRHLVYRHWHFEEASLMGCDVSMCQWCAMFHWHVNMFRTAHRTHHVNPEEKELNPQTQHSYSCK